MAKHVFVLIAIISLSRSQIFGADLRYTITIPKTDSSTVLYTADAINNVGQITGVTYTNHVYLYTDQHMVDLGSLGGINITPLDINDHGDIVGYSVVLSSESGTFVPNGFLYHNGSLINLTVLAKAQGLAMQIPKGINNAGTIVGQGVIYANGVFSRLLPSSSSMDTIKINNIGQVAGTFMGPGPFNPFIWTNGVVSDLGTFGGLYNESVGINDSGQVIGRAITSNAYPPPEHAVFYSEGVSTLITTPLGTDTYAQDINNDGLVVGYYHAPLPGGDRAFLYDHGTFIDLNSLIPSDSGLTLLRANGINNLNQIVGNAIDAQGTQFAFLLTPVPEPTTLILLGGAAFSILCRRRRK